MIAVVDYGIGNLRSAEKALQHLGADARLTTDAQRDRTGRRGRAPGCRRVRRVHAGAPRERPRSGHQGRRDRRPAVPRDLHRHADAVRRQRRDRPTSRASASSPGASPGCPTTVRLPQMGWNTLESRRGRLAPAAPACPIPRGCYFVHSYAPEPADDRDVAAWCDYGRRFAAAIERGPVWATQFHPEKSRRGRPARCSRNFVKAAA